MQRIHQFLLGFATCAGLLVSDLSRAEEPASNSGWISHPHAPMASNPVVLQFRNRMDLKNVPASYPVQVSADNRFILYVNGKRVGAGPSAGTLSHWRYSEFDLVPYLQSGQNIITAQVWNGVKPIKVPDNATERQRQAALGAALFYQTAPNFQQTKSTGFLLRDLSGTDALSTNNSGWQVKKQLGHSFTNGWKQLKGWFYVAGHPEIIDSHYVSNDWHTQWQEGGDWVFAASAPEAARVLVRDKLPQQKFQPVSAGTLVRSDLASAKGFPLSPVQIPANSKHKLLLQREVMVSAYPGLQFSGGKDAVIQLTYSEAMHHPKTRKKADRNYIGDWIPVGPTDRFIVDGKANQLSTLWWRTWRYLEIEIETKDEPLQLQGLSAMETGYPFIQVADFNANDPDLARIFQVGWRTAQVDAHETYMDTAFWEQLQYVGDTRLQMLISYAVSGDPRLAEQAIDAYASSNVEGGLMDSAYPSRSPNVIATFSLLWVGMLHDWYWQQPDPQLIRNHLPRMRQVLDWYSQWQQSSGLLGKNPQWNFIDWVGQPATDRVKFPSWGKAGESCLTSAHWLGALQQGAELEQSLGDKALAEQYNQSALKLAAAIKQHCWNAERGLFADNPDLDKFSQHMNALAILYDLTDQATAKQMLKKLVAPAKGIDAPDGITSTSYYFSWYLVRAYVKAGMQEEYLSLLATWKNLLKLNFTTWPEERGDSRSDTHAWSAHPTADLLGIVAGIQPGSPGYQTLLVAPALGDLTELDAVSATPFGPVKVSYRREGKKLAVKLSKPELLSGYFRWYGQQIKLSGSSVEFEVDRP